MHFSMLNANTPGKIVIREKDTKSELMINDSISQKMKSVFGFFKTSGKIEYIFV